MGIQDVFSAAANFTGITHNDYLRIGEIIQNAKIEVDEEGTIAAAVTGINWLARFVHLLDASMCVWCFAEFAIVPLMGETMPTFIANRPFIFAIVDLVTTETLFAGRFISPARTWTIRVILRQVFHFYYWKCLREILPFMYI